MTRRILTLLVFCTTAVFAADAPPSEASVKKLLDVVQARQLIDTMKAQINGYFTQAMQQMMQGQQITPEIQKQIDQGRGEAMSMMNEFLDWNKLEPVYVRIYQKSFTQQEIDNLIAMYQTPAGQIMLKKMPVVMQNTMAEMQQMMQPLMQRIQQKQQEVAAKIQSKKKGGS
jgi:uncharacterized protein